MAIEKCGLNLNADQRELRSHGTLEFPCAGYREYHTDQAEDGVPWHWHDELEAVYIVAGQFRVQVPGQSYTMRPGDFLLINTGVLHSAAAEPFCELYCMVFSAQLIAGRSDSVFAKKYLGPLLGCAAFRAYRFDPAAQADLIGGFAAAFLALERDDPGFEFAVRSNLSALCLALYKQLAPQFAAPQTEPRPDDLRVRKMMHYIQTNYAAPLTLAQIAREANIGERECMRCFQRTIQLSPMQYLLKYRILQGADRLLASPTENVSEIAAACGFDSPSNFSKLFRRYFGATPRAYRDGRKQAAAVPSSVKPAQQARPASALSFAAADAEL